MDKRLIMAVLAVWLAMATATAEWYQDWNRGYSGSANVYYQGSTKKGASLESVCNRGLNNMRNNGVYVGNRIDKLTKEQSWLLAKAITSQYDYSAGDIFTIIMGETNFDYIAVVVEITAIDSGGGFYYSWLAYPIGF